MENAIRFRGWHTDQQKQGFQDVYAPAAGLLPAPGFLLPSCFPTQFITLTEVVLVLPAESRAVTAMVWVPLLAFLLFQL